MKEGNGSANCLDFDKSGQVLVVGYEDAIIRIFNPKNGKKETEYRGHEDSILDVKFNIKNKCLLSSSADKTFRIWQ